jgi:hypothetical protein
MHLTSPGRIPGLPTFKPFKHLPVIPNLDCNLLDEVCYTQSALFPRTVDSAPSLPVTTIILSIICLFVIDTYLSHT